MSETKEFPTLVVASTITGIAMTVMKISDMHECAEWLCGHPVWTHELAHKQIQDRYSAEGRRQFPNMPTNAEAEADFQQAADAAIAAYGAVVPVLKGQYERDTSPIETLRSTAPSADVIVVEVGGGHNG